MFAEHPDVHFVAVRRGQCLLNILTFILLLSREVSVRCLLNKLTFISLLLGEEMSMFTVYLAYTYFCVLWL